MKGPPDWVPANTTEEWHMATRSVLTLTLVILELIIITLVPLESGIAQDTRERWGFGVRAGGNIWFNDYSQRVVGEGGELMLRYGINRVFSAGLLFGYEELKSNQDPPIYLKVQAIPGSVVGWMHFAYDKPFNPYLYLGVGAMIYKRSVGGNVDLTGGELKTSFHVPAGVGFEARASQDVSITADIGYRIVDDNTDGRISGKLGIYATAKVGVNIYFGAGVTEKQELAKAEAHQANEPSEANAAQLKVLADLEALSVKALAALEELRIKDSTEAEAIRMKDSTEAEARRLPEFSARNPADTVIILERGKTVVLKGINFESGKATLTNNSEGALRTALNALLASETVNVLIVGHTDNVGKAAYNKKLSLRRAQTVKSWLIKRKISARRLTVAGKGSAEPIDDNSMPEGRANNRRIEFRAY
jgi:outer membrane protein OmpA-like peptidoglycan-associated protein